MHYLGQMLRSLVPFAPKPYVVSIQNTDDWLSNMFAESTPVTDLRAGPPAEKMRYLHSDHQDDDVSAHPNSPRA